MGLPVKEYQIIDKFLGEELKDEVMKVKPVQKQTKAGQRTRFKAYVAVGDHNGHVGVGTKPAKGGATSIRGAIINAKLQLIPVRRGYWGAKIGNVHTVPCKLTGKCGSVLIRLIPRRAARAWWRRAAPRSSCKWRALRMCSPRHPVTRVPRAIWWWPRSLRCATATAS